MPLLVEFIETLFPVPRFLVTQDRVRSLDCHEILDESIKSVTMFLPTRGRYVLTEPGSSKNVGGGSRGSLS